MNPFQHYLNQTMKSQKLTTAQVLTALVGFELFGRAERPGHISMTTVLIVDKLEPVQKAFEKAKQPLFEKWGLKRTIPAKGEQPEHTEFVPVIQDGKVLAGSKQIAPEHLSAYSIEMEILEAVEIEISTPELLAADIQKLSVAPNILRMIRPFISEAAAQ